VHENRSGELFLAWIENLPNQDLWGKGAWKVKRNRGFSCQGWDLSTSTWSSIRATQFFVRRSSFVDSQERVCGIKARLSAPWRLFVSELRKYTRHVIVLYVVFTSSCGYGLYMDGRTSFPHTRSWKSTNDERRTKNWVALLQRLSLSHTWDIFRDEKTHHFLSWNCVVTLSTAERSFCDNLCLSKRKWRSRKISYVCHSTLKTL